MESSSFSGSSKRAKAPANTVSSPIANCMVDGCNADLSLCRDYHRRHKVCEAHSKTSRVTIGGREQRFCQQCSRFHSLGEFDEGKRSCRKRLDGHNRRRRKSQMDPIPRTGLIFSTQPAPSTSRLLSFSTPQLLPNSTMSSSWTTNLIKPQNNIAIYNHPQYPSYPDQQQTSMFPESSTYKGGIVNQQLSFMQRNIPPSRPILDSDKIFCDGLNQVVDSDRALSLLSSSSPSVTREFIMNHQFPQASSLVNDLQYANTNNTHGLGQFNPFGQESKPITSVTDSRDSDVSTLHFPGMLHHHQVNEGSSTSGTHQTLSFMWE